jgi:hypothetical protein
MRYSADETPAAMRNETVYARLKFSHAIRSFCDAIGRFSWR